MYINYAIWAGGSGGLKDDFFRWGGIPNRKGQFSFGRIGQRNVEEECGTAVWM